MTPWHCSVAVTARGEFKTEHAMIVREDHDLIYQNGRPYYFRDRDDVWKWDGVEFEFFAPRGVRVIAKPVAEGQGKPRLGEAELKKLSKLEKAFSSVVTFGFD